MRLSAMHYIRAAFSNARAEGLTQDEIWQAIEHSETPSAFDANINAIVQANDAMRQKRRGMAYCGGRWIEIG